MNFSVAPMFSEVSLITSINLIGELLSISIVKESKNRERMHPSSVLNFILFLVSYPNIEKSF